MSKDSSLSANIWTSAVTGPTSAVSGLADDGTTDDVIIAEAEPKQANKHWWGPGEQQGQQASSVSVENIDDEEVFCVDVHEATEYKKSRNSSIWFLVSPFGDSQREQLKEMEAEVDPEDEKPRVGSPSGFLDNVYEETLKVTSPSKRDSLSWNKSLVEEQEGSSSSSPPASPTDGPAWEEEVEEDNFPWMKAVLGLNETTEPTPLIEVDEGPPETTTTPLEAETTKPRCWGGSNSRSGEKSTCCGR